MSEYEQSQPQKKSPWGKILIGCGIVAVLGVLAVGGGLWWLFSGFTMDSQKVATLAAEIAPGATVPEGYEGAMGLDFMGFKMVIITSPGAMQGNQPRGGAVFIVMASAPSGVSASLETQVRQKLAEQTGQGGGEITRLEGETITVGDEELEFQKHLVTDEDDTRMLQYVGTMPPRDGRVTMFMFMGPEASFDRPAMDAFLGSILPAGK